MALKSDLWRKVGSRYGRVPDTDGMMCHIYEAVLVTIATKEGCFYNTTMK